MSAAVQRLDKAEANSDWWQPATPGTCWVCGELSPWAWLDLGYQHIDCDAYPFLDGHRTVIHGVVA